ncbi:MAG: Lrp/AsnC family transcriptional regulator [Methanomassiliicoccales archaeon]
MNRRILRLLGTDGKMSYREVAQRLNRSPSTVRDRIGRMEEDGIILGYVALVNAEQMGMRAEGIVLADIAEGFTVGDLRELKEIEGVTEVLFVSGEKNVMVRVQAEDNRQLEEVVSGKIASSGLTDIELIVALDSVMRFPEVSLE